MSKWIFSNKLQETRRVWQKAAKNAQKNARIHAKYRERCMKAGQLSAFCGKRAVRRVTKTKEIMKNQDYKVDILKESENLREINDI